MQHLPNARLGDSSARSTAHDRSESVLMEGVRAVYGKEIADRDYGELVPGAGAERVVTTDDGMVDRARRSTAAFSWTRPVTRCHHHCIWDEASRGWFTGDTFGIVYPELENAAWPVHRAGRPRLCNSISRRCTHRWRDCSRASPTFMYLTHYGAVAQPRRAVGTVSGSGRCDGGRRSRARASAGSPRIDSSAPSATSTSSELQPFGIDATRALAARHPCDRHRAQRPGPRRLAGSRAAVSAKSKHRLTAGRKEGTMRAPGPSRSMPPQPNQDRAAAACPGFQTAALRVRLTPTPATSRCPRPARSWNRDPLH